MMVAAGTTPNITYEKEHAGTFQLDSKKKFFAPHRAKRNDGGGFTLEPVRTATAGSLLRTTKTAGSSLTTETIIRYMQATSSRRWRRLATDIRMSPRCSRTNLRRWIPSKQEERDLAWKRLCAHTSIASLSLESLKSVD